MLICENRHDMTTPSLITTPEIVAAFRAKNWTALEGLVKQYTEILLKGALGLVLLYRVKNRLRECLERKVDQK